MWGNGYYKPRNLEVGTPVVKDANPIIGFCFATGIRGLGRLLPGNKDEPQGMEEKGQVLTGCDVSSLVIDSLCNQAGGQNIAVACFYFDFAAQKDQSPTNTLGSLLKQVVSGLEEVPEEIVLAYEAQKKVLSGRGPLLSDIVEMLQAASSKKRTFICIDALDECAAGDRVKILNSLKQVLQKSPDTRIFVTGRSYIRVEIENCLSRRVTTILITPRRDDVIRYLYSRLAEDTMPDAMDGGLKADILKKIPDEISEMYIEATLPGIHFKISANRYLDSF